ncbi:FAD-binding protein [bacterium]|nr:FAD-binding protein [bacterium]
MDIEKLKKIVGEDNLRDDVAELYIYGSDASVHQTDKAQVVVKPQNTKHVQEVMKYANENMIPVTARGIGSGTSGHAVPIDGGIVLDLKDMDKIIEISPENIICKVEPGVVNDELNRQLQPYGFFFAPTPASGKVCTIGGMIANNASGIRSVKYGATRDSLLGMKVVLANGDLVEFGSNTRVDAAGFQLARLMVGSEGMLGIVVEATLKLTPLPKLRCLAISKFNKLEEAGKTISDVMSSGATPSMLELMDDIAIQSVNKAFNLGLPDVEAVIIFEADGMIEATVDGEIERIIKICEKNNGFGFEMSYDAKRRAEIYEGRKKLFSALSRYREGYVCADLADDMAVPNSQMAATAHAIHEIAKKNNVIMTAYGHCGSGVIHTKILLNPSKKEQWDDARKAVEELYDFVDSVGGITSGEHGIALSKAPSWKKSRMDIIPITREVKKAFDPNNILNPHKLMDAPDDWVTATELRYRVKE